MLLERTIDDSRVQRDLSLSQKRKLAGEKEMLFSDETKTTKNPRIELSQTETDSK